MPDSTPPKMITVFDLSKANVDRKSMREYFHHRAPYGIKWSWYDLETQGLSDKVILMNSESAGTYVFQTGQQQWGPTEALKQLVDRGINVAFIDLDWVKNHYRWIVWKLCSYIRSFPFDYHATILARRKYFAICATDTSEKFISATDRR